MMRKRKTFPLKQGLTRANYIVYEGTCNFVRCAINNILAKH